MEKKDGNDDKNSDSSDDDMIIPHDEEDKFDEEDKHNIEAEITPLSNSPLSPGGNHHHLHLKDHNVVSNVLHRSTQNLKKSVVKNKKALYHQMIGILFVFITSLLQALTMVLVKNINMNSIDIATYTGLFVYLGSQVPIVKGGFGKLGGKKGIQVLALRGLCGGIGYQLWYYTLKNMALGEATVIRATASGLAIIMAWIILKERPGISEVMAFFAMMFGIVVIAQPSFIFKSNISINSDYPNRNLAIICVCCVSLLNSVIIVLLRKLGIKSIGTFGSPYALGFGIWTVGAVVGLSINGKVTTPSCGIDKFYLICLGFLMIAPHVTFQLSLRYLNAGIGGALRSMDIVFAFLFQYIIFHENEESYWSFIGTGVIMSASVLIGIKVALVSTNKQCFKIC